MFSLRDTLESGQVFRFRYVDGGALLAHGSDLHSIPESGETRDERLAHLLAHDRLVLDHPHPYVREAIGAHPGLRILRQEPWECLVTFIISQNNHQKRIQKNCLALSEAFGTPIGEGFHAFPKPPDLGSEEELRALGLGYRARWIAQLRDIDMDWLEGLSALPYAEAKRELCTLNGIGPKVADCILLFSLGFDEACPEDTWIKKVFERTGLTREALGPQAGLLQQYMFHHARSHA